MLLWLASLSSALAQPREVSAQRRDTQCARPFEPDTVERVRADIAYLADDAREGRAVGTPGFDDSVRWLTAALRAMGARPGGSDGYLQRFAVNVRARSVHSEPGAGRVETVNVLARIPGTRPDGRTLLVGAHLDHIGRGAWTSRSRSRAVHNGADDNASGVAAVLELTRRLISRPVRRDVVLAWFGAEELGLLGSTFLATHPVEATRTIETMINFDMVGRLRRCRVYVEGTERSPALTEVVAHANGRWHFDVRPWDAQRFGAWGASDHMSFSSRGVPTLFFFTGLHDDYHTERDDLSRVNVEGVVSVLSLAEHALREIADHVAAQ